MREVEPFTVSRPSMVTDVLFPPKAVAGKWGISTRTLWRWVATGKFPAPDVRNGDHFVRWRASTLDAWVAEHSTTNA